MWRPEHSGAQGWSVQWSPGQQPDKITLSVNIGQHYTTSVGYHTQHRHWANYTQDLQQQYPAPDTTIATWEVVEMGHINYILPINDEADIIQLGAKPQLF